MGKKEHFRRILCCMAVMLAAILEIPAQDGYKTLDGKLLPYIVEEGDTVYLAPLAAARIYEKKPRKKGRQWRKYYKLVYNFAKVYPYSLVAKDVVAQVDSTIQADHLKYISKDRYVEKVVKELFNAFEKPMKNLTVTQGQLLMKLVDRQCGIPSYTIIKEFKNRYAAVFWQGVAKMFGNDLKKPYDPQGEDAPIEELIQQWEKGTFEQTYFEIFWKYPPMVELPEKYRRPDISSGHGGAAPKTASKAVPTQRTSR